MCREGRISLGAVTGVESSKAVKNLVKGPRTASGLCASFFQGASHFGSNFALSFCGIFYGIIFIVSMIDAPGNLTPKRGRRHFVAYE
jgi:hypothetical protein